MKESTRKRLDTRRLLGPRLTRLPFDKPPAALLEPRKFVRRVPRGHGPAT